MYALVENGQIKIYPYTPEQLRQDNPNVSFPVEMTNKALAAWGVFPVLVLSPPAADHTQNRVEGVPVMDASGRWAQSWQVVPASEEQVQVRTQDKAQEVRAERDARIAAQAWRYERIARQTRMGVPVTDDIAVLDVYMQSLADVPQQPGFPWNVSWPDPV